MTAFAGNFLMLTGKVDMPVCWIVFGNLLPFTPFYSVTVAIMISEKVKGK